MGTAPLCPDRGAGWDILRKLAGEGLAACAAWLSFVHGLGMHCKLVSPCAEGSVTRIFAWRLDLAFLVLRDPTLHAVLLGQVGWHFLAVPG